MGKDFVLKGNICYSKSAKELALVADGYLVCEEGLCTGVFQQLPQQYQHLPLEDCTGKMILPGLVDIHVHAPQYAFRCLGMDMELIEWLSHYAFPEEAKYKDLAYAEKAYGSFVEDLRQGPNTRAAVFATCHVPASLLLMDMLEASGLVTLVGKVNMDRNSHPQLQESGPEASARDTEAWVSLILTEKAYHNTAPILTPRFIPSCSDGLMVKLKEIQQKYGLPVQSHLSENKGEIAWVRELCPDAANYSAAYDYFGLFGGSDTPTIMAHCVWMEEEELALMAERQVFVAHCPQSNMNLASGIAPIRRFLDRGIPVGLGSDVAGGCHTSIFRAMSDAIQVSKLYWRLLDQNEAPLAIEEAFYLGTMGGGAFFGKVGSFLPSYEFDALVIDDSKLEAPYDLSLNERLARIIYDPDRCILERKFVRGRDVLHKAAL